MGQSEFKICDFQKEVYSRDETYFVKIKLILN